MDDKKTEFPDDRTERQRRKDLSDDEVKDLESAGGVEGGMQAGSAGQPGGSDGDPSGQPEKGVDQFARPGR